MSENGKSTATSIDLAGTYLEEMARILNTGDFIPAPEEQVADGEIVIGEMNALEKACHSAARRFGERADEMTNESMATANSEEEMVSTQKASARRFNIFKAMSEMKWASITARLGEACTEGRGIAIRSGYKIVSVPEQKKPSIDELPPELAELFGSLPGSVHIIGMDMGSPFGEEE